jgi:hypothetical protein
MRLSSLLAPLLLLVAYAQGCTTEQSIQAQSPSIPANGYHPDSLEGNWTNVTCLSSDQDCWWTYSSCTTPLGDAGRPPHQTHTHSEQKNGTTTDLKAQQRRKFEGVFETLRDELLDHLKGENMPDEAVEWFRRVRPHLPLVQDRRG